jgi:hypothetical protein
MKAGTVWINCYNIFDAALPFGGYKQCAISKPGDAALRNKLVNVAIDGETECLPRKTAVFLKLLRVLSQYAHVG